MGKLGELCDDSALINAFDDAIRKYKMMNLGQDYVSSAEGGKVSSGGREYVSDIAAGNDIRSSSIAATGQMDTSNTEKETREANNVSRVRESHREDSDALEYEKQAEEYNALVAKYNELEAERQKVLELLQSYNGQHYLNFGAECGPSYQQYSVPYTQQSYQNVDAAWAPLTQQYSENYAPANYPTGAYPYQSSSPWAAPCCVAPACDIGRTVCNTSGADMSDKSCQIESNDIINKAMEAAKKAESFTRTEYNFCSNENKVTGKEDDRSVAQTSSQETDLFTVLNAWYSVGLYTGKYLAEQSVTKK